jgi:uncharacterized DUF497 family protein
MPGFEWDVSKDRANQAKHGISFDQAQHAFLDPLRVIAEDLGHGEGERRYFCFGRVEDGRSDDGALHLAARKDPDFWCRLLAERKVDL